MVLVMVLIAKSMNGEALLSILAPFRMHARATTAPSGAIDDIVLGIIFYFAGLMSPFFFFSPFPLSCFQISLSRFQYLPTSWRKQKCFKGLSS
jgi:hypothetical protein